MNEPRRRDDFEAGHQPAGREPIFNIPAVVLLLIAVNVGVHLVRVYLLDPFQDEGLILRGAFIPLRYSGEYLLDVYAFTSPLTYSLLHGNLAHLALNMVWLAAFGTPLANRIGNLRFLLFWCLTALAAVALHYVLHAEDAIPLIGASGAISGMMGAAARFGFRTERAGGRPRFGGRRLGFAESLSSRIVIVFLAVWLGANLLAGLGFLDAGGGNPIAWEAHVGGFLAGFLGIGLLDRRPAA